MDPLISIILSGTEVTSSGEVSTLGKGSSAGAGFGGGSGQGERLTVRGTGQGICYRNKQGVGYYGQGYGLGANAFEGREGMQPRDREAEYVGMRPKGGIAHLWTP